MKERMSGIGRCDSPFSLLPALILVFTLFHFPAECQVSPQGVAVVQKTFATPEFAADALVKAARQYDVRSLLDIFGPTGKDLVSSADPVQDKRRAEEFVAKADEKTRVVVDAKNGTRATLLVGNDEWP